MKQAVAAAARVPLPPPDAAKVGDRILVRRSRTADGGGDVYEHVAPEDFRDEEGAEIVDDEEEEGVAQAVQEQVRLVLGVDVVLGAGGT